MNFIPTYRTLIWVVVVSVAVNVFLVGFGAARVLGRDRHGSFIRDPHGSGPRPGFGPGPGMAGGPAVDPQLRGLLRERLGPLRQRRGVIQQAREQVRRVLEAEPFDPVALEAALGELRREGSAAQTAIHAELLKLAQESSSEQRHHLAQTRWFTGDAERP